MEAPACTASWTVTASDERSWVPLRRIKVPLVLRDDRALLVSEDAGRLLVLAAAPVADITPPVTFTLEDPEPVPLAALGALQLADVRVIRCSGRHLGPPLGGRLLGLDAGRSGGRVRRANLRRHEDPSPRPLHLVPRCLVAVTQSADVRPIATPGFQGRDRDQ